MTTEPTRRSDYVWVTKSGLVAVEFPDRAAFFLQPQEARKLGGRLQEIAADLIGELIDGLDGAGTLEP